jgi:NADP-dependent 3-hydroxy acid dehydrogenase YdfG
MTRLKSWTTSPVKACDRYGQLDVLINNAGIMPVSLLDDLRVQDWENMITLANGKDVTRPGRHLRHWRAKCESRHISRLVARKS